jgi:hypothetical protein
LDFFGLGVAFQVLDLHAVFQRPDDAPRVVAGEDEFHFAQVGFPRIEILKAAVLCRVEDLQKDGLMAGGILSTSSITTMGLRTRSSGGPERRAVGQFAGMGIDVGAEKTF